MAEIILPKEGEVLKINKNEGVSYAILRKVLKDGETMSKSDLEKEFLKLDKDSRTELVKLSNKIDYTLKKPILEGTEFKIPGDQSLEKSFEKTVELKILEKEGLSHTILRAKLGEQANSMSISDLEKYFSSLDKEVKNKFLKNLKELEKEIKGPLIAGTSIKVSLEKFDIGNISPKKVEEPEKQNPEVGQKQADTTELLEKRKEVYEKAQNLKELEAELDAKKYDLSEQNLKIKELEEKLSDLKQEQSETNGEIPKENKTPEKTDENLKKG